MKIDSLRVHTGYILGARGCYGYSTSEYPQATKGTMCATRPIQEAARRQPLAWSEASGIKYGSAYACAPDLI